ncbi:MAG: hypothetical protein JWN52_3586 [Actinomycetia bacterium]|nr:hypothetical protein [Actinomycetes bacterium]
MTRYFFDTEFLEDGRTIDLISIGIVCEDGREYYAVNSEAPWDRIKEHRWLMANVWPGLPLHGQKEGLVSVGGGNHEVRLTTPGVIDTSDSCVKPRWVIANEVRDFLLAAPDVIDLWADYGAYDHVVLCQMYGSMMRLPKGFPMFTHDIQQEASRLGLTDEDLPQQADGHHNALADARHAKVVFDFLGAHDA